MQRKCIHNVWEMWWEWRTDQKFPNTIFLCWQEDTKLDRGQHHLLYHHHHQLKGTARQKTDKQFWGCKSDDTAVQPAPKHLAECQHSYLALENHFSLCFAWCLVFSKKLRFAILLNKNFFSSILLEVGECYYEFCFYTTSRQSTSWMYYLLSVPYGGCEVPAKFHDGLSTREKNHQFCHRLYISVSMWMHRI